MPSQPRRHLPTKVRHTLFHPWMARPCPVSPSLFPCWHLQNKHITIEINEQPDSPIDIYPANKEPASP